RVARAKFQAVVVLQLLPLDAFPVDERAVLAALIYKKELPVFQKDLPMIARHPGICDHQILVDLAPYAERCPVEHNIFLLVPLHQNQSRKNPRTWATRMLIDGS